MKRELIPDIELPYTSIVTVYPKASPDEVLNKVTVPIENVVWERWAGKGLKHLYSTSSEGISAIFAEFEFGTDMNETTSSIKQGISELTLPPEVLSLPQMNPVMGENPRVIPINLSMMPLVVLSLSGNISAEQVKAIADNQIVPVLESIDGVLAVEIEGGDEEQVLIIPDPAKMVEHNVSLSQIAWLLAPEYYSLDEIRNTPIGTDSVVLGDIAEVSQGPAPNSVVTRTNGKPSLGILVMKKDEANTVDVANAVTAKVDEIKKTLGDGVELVTVFDQSDFIESSINQLWEKALIGGALAIVVVFIFLLAVRASLVTAISIPLSLLTGFLVMRAFDITINVLTLSAMSIAVGRLIDDSIVMVEVIYRRLQQGESFREAAINGSKEIAMPITSATLATVAIFIPLMFVGGIVGELFIPFALTVTFAMLASLAVALMVVPALSDMFVGERTKAKVGETWYQKLYVRTLKWALSHRLLTLVIAAVLFVGSLGLVPVIGTSFMHGMSEKILTVDIRMPAGTDLKTTDEIAKKVEALLDKNASAIESYHTEVGVSTSLFGAMSSAMGGGDNTASIEVYLAPDADMDKEAEKLRLATEGLAGAGKIVVTTSESESGGGMGFSGLEISIEGEDQEALKTTTLQLVDKLRGMEGLVNLETEFTMIVPKLDIEIDPIKATALELSPEQLQQFQQEFYVLKVGSTVPGKVATIDGQSYPVFIGGVVSGLNGAAEAESLRIGWPDSIALGDIANVALLEMPTHISHTDLKLSASIRAAITEKNVGAINRAVQEKIDALPSHPGVEVKIGGVAEEMEETFSRMGIAIIAAIVISFLILVVSMRSLLNPLIIMVSLPLASIGALLALLLSGYTLGVSGMMGILMLVGIVLTNAIVLIALIEQLRKGGMNTYDAIIQGGQTRLRPILMTALTTIFAMIPLALGVGQGTFIAAELAIVVIGGLFTSTLLTLLVIPVIYSLIDGLRRRTAKTG
jgi:HAE1 family hydrophobic/amphiphilic exporter-1